ncbi:thiol:disulfide interchange protein DsbA/DsbL [Luteimonas sp. RIT-PG2_3]
MTLHRALVPLALGLLLMACGQKDAPADAATPPAVEAPAATTPAPAADAATPPADSTAASTPADAAASATPAAAPTPATPVPGLTPGKDYDIIQGGQRFAAGSNIEVAEVFAYWCGACAQFDPLVSAWSAKLPADVKFTYVPAVFNAQDNYPRAFYAAEAAGILPKTHSTVFQAIHLERSLKPTATLDDLAAFYAKHGANAANFKSTMESFAVNANLGRARQFAIRSGINHTPTLVINGKYRINGTSHENQLQIADAIIAHERGAATP